MTLVASLVLSGATWAGRAQWLKSETAVAELVQSWRRADSVHPLTAYSFRAGGTGAGDAAAANARLSDLGRIGSPLGSADAPSVRQIALVGEVHDNAEHHKFRARQLEPISVRSVVFEQLRTDQQPAIDAFMALPKGKRTLDAFLGAVEWDASGWAKYDYKPLLEAVIAADLPIYAGDPPKELIRKAAKEGRGALAAEERQRLGLDTPLDPSLHDAALAELEASHCGAMPKSAFGGMAFAQRLRDATLADVALKANERHGAVTVFAGNGHVRSDRGVPWYLRLRAPGLPVTATMLVEVENGKTDPEAYVPRGPDGKPAADSIVFTPRAAREDPCAAFGGAPSRAAPITKN